MFIVYRDEKIIRPNSVRSDIWQWMSLLTELKTKPTGVTINISPLRGSRNSHDHKIR
jgi:hypothetical protein